ncbi:MAG: lysophospholipid acyltransferase family protein [Alphaproteobacteria bacterium]|nr:lysophospholipid acyltransferase family protein [Alphaproteobacteria bacterium]
MMERMKHALEAFAAGALFLLFRLLPLDAASALGGTLARAVGPHLRVSGVAYDNLSNVFPDIAREKSAAIVTGMWEHFGRIAAEYPHLAGRAVWPHIAVEGTEHIEALKASGKGAIFISGHFGNWELSPRILKEYGLPMGVVYRAANNPWVDSMICYLRGRTATAQYAKGTSDAIGIVRALKRGEVVGFLVDQKMNDGIPVPFFGRDAMTAPAVAEFAFKLGIPIVPMRVVRENGTHFKATVYAPLQFLHTDDHARDVHNAMLKINSVLEGWIREFPEQWFWVHRRWPKE